MTAPDRKPDLRNLALPLVENIGAALTQLRVHQRRPEDGDLARAIAALDAANVLAERIFNELDEASA